MQRRDLFHEIYEGLKKILIREKRHELYNKTIKFIHNRVDLDLASFNLIFGLIKNEEKNNSKNC